LAEVIDRRADQVTDVLDEKDIAVLRREVVQSTMNQTRIEMTGRSRRDGRRDDTRSVQPIGVAIGRQVTADSPELEVLACRLGGRLENRGLSGPRRAHQIDRQHA